MCKTHRRISRGQVWYLVDPNSSNYDSSIQGKNRPVLIVSNDLCNQNSPVIHIVPFTTQPKSHLPTHVTFNDGKFDQTILCEQLRLVKESLFYDQSYYKYTLSDDIMQKVDEALVVQLGLSLIMPNSERFWKSVEQVIRLKVKDAMNDVRVSAIDISKISCLVTNAIDNQIGEPEPCVIPLENFTQPPAPDVSVQMAQNIESKRAKNNWDEQSKRDFCDTYYKYGPQAAADKYGVKLGSAYRLKWNFEKELKDGTTGK